MTPDDLTQIPGIGEKTVEKIRRVVTDYFEQDDESSAALAAAAEAEAVKVDEPLGEHPATLEEAAEIPEEESSAESAAAEVSDQAGVAEPAPEQAESSEEEGLAGGKGEKEE
jgi:Holliday junction resolvasome RuvABC DNA-binding subunit